MPNTDANPGLRPGKGYYSYDLGTWHIISLNSNCSKVSGGCNPVVGKTFSDSASGQCHGTSSSGPGDTTAPTVTSTVPASNATGVSPTANVKATFSENMALSSINGTTFTLKVKGSTTKLAAAIGYDPNTRTATLDPTDSLQTGVTYKAAVTTGAKDLAGNRLDQDGTKTGSQQKAWLFTVGN